MFTYIQPCGQAVQYQINQSFTANEITNVPDSDFSDFCEKDSVNSPFLMSEELSIQIKETRPAIRIIQNGP